MSEGSDANKREMMKPLFGEEEIRKLKYRLPMIETLAMLKMEKNFIALEKGYPRQPYASEKQPIAFMIHHIEQELTELKEAYEQQNIIGMQEECADISNIQLFKKIIN